MASRSFLPDADGALAAWARNFSQRVGESPESFGVSQAQSDAFTELTRDFLDALANCEPTIRCVASTIRKNDARTAMKASAGRLSRIIQGQGVSDAKRAALGLNVRGAKTYAPRPTDAPGIQLVSVNAWTIRIELNDTSVDIRRFKPRGVAGASVFSHCGENPPNDFADWRFEGNTGRRTIDIAFPSHLPMGTRVWATACWFNGRKQVGRPAVPVSAHLHGGWMTIAA